MSTSIADERRLLAADEYEPVARSHYPALAGLKREELLELVRWLRDQRGKFRGQIEHRRRVRRGKADARGTAAEPPSERGVAAKKQVFARALKRANARLDGVLAAEKRAAMRAGMHAALERKRRAPVHHPASGRRRAWRRAADRKSQGRRHRAAGHDRQHLAGRPCRPGAARQQGIEIEGQADPHARSCLRRVQQKGRDGPGGPRSADLKAVANAARSRCARRPAGRADGGAGNPARARPRRRAPSRGRR